MTKANIFLSYRRDDSVSETRNIRDALEHSGHNVFMDKTSIELGKKWPDEIRMALENSEIVIAIIGNKWLTANNPDGRRRIDGENDWVRLELKTALQKNKTIIPILINWATMPSLESLPDDLKELSNCQALHCSEDNWENNIKTLLSMLAQGRNTLPKPKPTFLLTSASPRRKELLKQIGWDEGIDYFTIHASVNLEPENGPQLSLDDAKIFAEKTACSKINWVMNHSHDISDVLGLSWKRSATILIGVDTIVFCNNKILDRPLLKALHLAGPEDLEAAQVRAKEMLMEQKGKKIYVITSLALAVANNHENPVVETVVTEAELRPYSEDDIDNYILHSQPFDKAGAFGIQEKGISLFRKIKGSYTNVVGLPLQEFISLLNENYGKIFALPELKSSLSELPLLNNANLSVACVGDINYDYIYDKFPENFFSNIQPPGNKIIGAIHRAVGGTAVNFAKGAKKAGFATCYVIGMIGGDALGTQIQHELHQQHGITAISKFDPNDTTSIAIIFRDTAQQDTSITITDAHQSLPEFVVGLASDTIKKSDIFYCSGYCIVDRNRRASALKMMEIAKQSSQLVVLDIVVGMHQHISLNEISKSINNNNNNLLVDVIAAELPEIFAWFHIDTTNLTELQAWELNKNFLMHELREKLQVALLRTSNYTHEIIVTPDEIFGPIPLDYGALGAREKVGYGDFRSARHMHSFLSPRVVLASKSPQRFNLLSQIISASKIEVVVSSSTEDKIAYEDPFGRVKRLALEKAETVLLEEKYHHDIELIIGADTEIIRKRKDGEWDMIGHPHSKEDAIRDLTNLNNSSHIAITGIAVIGKDPKTGTIKRFTDHVETKITFGNLSAEQISTYAETLEPIARAGAYAIQGLGTMLIKDLDGSYSNVVGLPLERLSEILVEEFNKPIWSFDKVSNWTFPDPIRSLLHS